METVRIGLAGFGTVGSGLARVLQENGDWIERRIGRRLTIKTVLVRDPSKQRAAQLGPDASFVTDPAALVDDPEIPVIVELMGGIAAAKSLIERALANGKHVITANKHLLAEHGPGLFALAAKHGRGLLYEASVAGGIPIVQALKDSLSGNRIEKLVGILNGTANYILSEMTTNGLEFDTALTQAQALGYAEADPTFDIEGVDTAHKLVVLIRLAYGRDYPLGALPVRGITGVTQQDIEIAREFGYRIKLLAQVRDVEGRLEAGVFPALVKHTFLLARVGGNYNAVRLEGNAVGPIMLHGQGAGSLPTASAVLADLMDVCRPGFVPDNTGFGAAPLTAADILPPELAVSCYYYRFTVADRPGVMAAIAKAMADHNISIAQAVQKGDESGTDVPIVFLTHAAQAKAAQAVAAEIDAMAFTRKPTVLFRIL
jgi:homoserine dehydrogenase